MSLENARILKRRGDALAANQRNARGMGRLPYIKVFEKHALAGADPCAGPIVTSVLYPRRTGGNNPAASTGSSAVPRSISLFACLESQRRISSATSVAVPSGSLAEVLPSRRIRNRLLKGILTNSIRCVGPPRTFRLMRMLAGGRDTFLTPRFSQLKPRCIIRRAFINPMSARTPLAVQT